VREKNDLLHRKTIVSSFAVTCTEVSNFVFDVAMAGEIEERHLILVVEELFD